MNNRQPKTTRRVGSRGKAVLVYLTEAALEDWYLIPKHERSARVQEMARKYAERARQIDQYAHNPTREKAEK